MNWLVLADYVDRSELLGEILIFTVLMLLMIFGIGWLAIKSEKSNAAEKERLESIAAKKRAAIIWGDRTITATKKDVPAKAEPTDDSN